MENMYHIWCKKLQQDIEDERESAETFGPRRQIRVERVVQRRLEQFNLQGFYVQVDREGEEENLKQQEISTIGRWPWDYPKYETSESTLRKWEGTRKFHDLMWDMQKYYDDKIWQLFKEKKLGFTYRSQFERNIKELPEELQALTFSKLWNKGRDGTRAHVLGATKHRGYHYKKEGLLYDLYVRKIFLPLYDGLNGSVGNQDSE